MAPHAINVPQQIPIITTQDSPPKLPDHSNMSPISEEHAPLDPAHPAYSPCRIAQWIENQFSQEDDDDNNQHLRDADLLACPQLSLRPTRTEQTDYILVDGESLSGQGNADGPRRYSPSPVPKHVPSIFNVPSSLRNFRLSFTPSRRASAFSRDNHSRGASLSAVDIPRSVSAMSTESSRRPHYPWNVTSNLRRPSVIDHFASQTKTTEESRAVEIPRPSMSSYGSYSTRLSSDTPSSIPTTIGYPYTQSSPAHRKPSPSLWSLPSTASHLNDPPGSTKLVSQSSRSTIRVPFPISFDNASSFLTNSRHRRKKKFLVVSGIARKDAARFEAVKRWCQSFGEIKNITRAPNSDDIIVDFRKEEVADTVCRVQARVHINGVGSVGLSWYAGKRL